MTVLHSVVGVSADLLLLLVAKVTHRCALRFEQVGNVAAGNPWRFSVFPGDELKQRKGLGTKCSRVARHQRLLSATLLV